MTLSKPISVHFKDETQLKGRHSSRSCIYQKAWLLVQKPALVVSIVLRARSDHKCLSHVHTENNPLPGPLAVREARGRVCIIKTKENAMRGIMHHHKCQRRFVEKMVPAVNPF